MIKESDINEVTKRSIYEDKSWFWKDNQTNKKTIKVILYLIDYIFNNFNNH